MSGMGAKSAYLSWLGAATSAEAMEAAAPAHPDETGDLVLGYATGYAADLIAPFVRSLRSVHSGPIALVVDDRPDVSALLAEHGVEALLHYPAEGWEPHPAMARFGAAVQLLARWPNIRHVLLTDVRDVVFQAPPFVPAPQRLETFVEYEVGTLGDHSFNMKYLRALAGEAMAQAVADKPCLCVGTVMGPRAEVLRFLRTVMMLAAIPRSEIGGAFGTDQAACNLAVHRGLIEAEIVPNYRRVATLGMTPSASLTFQDGKVVNPDGSTSAIVHQHDRHPHLADPVHDLWGAGSVRQERVQPKTAADRRAKLRQSIARRLPELR
jgi:hypothetical protein